MSRLNRIESAYNVDLDDQFAHDRLATILSHLQYSSDDARNNHPNPSKVEIDGKYYEGLQSLKTAVTNYRRFMDGAVGASATKHAAEQEQTLANAGQNRRPGLRADDVRDKRIAVLRTDFKRGESAQRYAEMVALVQRGEGKATFGDVLANTSYHMGDVRWDMHRGHIKVVDSSHVEQQRTLPMEGEL